MFILYVNDIGLGVTSTVRLFADDCLLYRTIDTDRDSSILLQYLTMTKWSDTWLMRCNEKKCHVMRMNGSRRNIRALLHYHIKGSSLEKVDHHPYLGVELTNDLS